MNVDEALKLLETKVKEDINDLTPKDRLLFWANLLEFKQAKIQRIPFLIPENDAKIIIEYEDYKTTAHASISKPVDKPEEN